MSIALVTACSNAPNASPPAASLPNGLTQPASATFADATITEGAEAELDQIAAARTAAGFEALLGDSGPAAFEALDAAETEIGETLLPDAAEQLEIDTTASALVGAAEGAPGSNEQPPPPGEWTGSVISHATFTVSMLTGMLIGAIERAGTKDAGLVKSTEKATAAVQDVTEDVSVTTEMSVATGDGRMTGDVSITVTAKATDANGNPVGTLTGKAHGHVNVNACPDGGGIAEGTLSLSRSEELGPAGGTGAGTAMAFDGNFRMVNGDDAHLKTIEAQFNMSKGAQGPGTAGGDPGEPFNWGATVGVPAVIDAKGSLSLDSSKLTSGGSATDAQLQETLNAYLSGYPILVEIGRKAEAFWRSGGCIEMKSSKDSKTVKPEEELSFDVESAAKFGDKAPISASITATFTGKEKLEPANTPLDPPAQFDFKAGKDEGDVGTIQLKQTSRRGVGKKTIIFTVKGGDLLLNVSGTLNDASLGSELTITFEPTTLKGAEGVYEGTAQVSVVGRMYLPGFNCSVPVNIAGDASVKATPDEADADLFRLLIHAGLWAGTSKVTLRCEDASVLLVVPAVLWFQVFTTNSGGFLITIDETTTRSGGVGAGNSMATVKLERVKPPQT